MSTVISPTIFIIPCQNTPQSFNISLANNNYIMNVVWNDSPDAGWFIGFTDADTNEIIVNNIPMVCGVDLLSGLEYLGFEGSFYVYTNGDATLVPTLDNLGIDCNLYFATSVPNG